MKYLIPLATLLLLTACASNVRVFGQVEDVPSTCQLRIGVNGIQTYSPAVAALGLKQLEIRVLDECKRTTAKLGLNAFAIKEFARRDEPTDRYQCVAQAMDMCASSRESNRSMVRADCRLTPRSSGRVDDKVPSPNVGVRAAQLNC